MERREIIRGYGEEIASVVRETAIRKGLHNERTEQDQTTFERARIFFAEKNIGCVVLLEDPTEVEETKLIAEDSFVDEVLGELSRVHVSLEPRAVLQPAT